jgi:hypothetical protein
MPLCNIPNPVIFWRCHPPDRLLLSLQDDTFILMLIFVGRLFFEEEGP